MRSRSQGPRYAVGLSIQGWLPSPPKSLKKQTARRSSATDWRCSQRQWGAILALFRPFDQTGHPGPRWGRPASGSWSLSAGLMPTTPMWLHEGTTSARQTGGRQRWPGDRHPRRRNVRVRTRTTGYTKQPSMWPLTDRYVVE